MAFNIFGAEMGVDKYFTYVSQAPSPEADNLNLTLKLVALWCRDETSERPNLVDLGPVLGGKETQLQGQHYDPVA